MTEAVSRTATATATNRLAALPDLGQSVWLDFIKRSLIKNGELRRLVEEDRLGGMTSNPAIFEKAIAGSDEYASSIASLAGQALSAKEIYERLAIEDIQAAADVLRVVYDRTKAHDGYASLEVSPELAKDTEGTIAEARRLWAAVGRPNVMIKVPATPEGIPAIRTLISEGISINITLLFARKAYEAVAWAYIEGQEARMKAGQPLDKIASVASFFVSRIDTLVDGWITEKAKTAGEADKARLNGLLGKVAIANAKLAYQSYKQIFSGPRWEALAAKGAMVQRVLWASTGTKNPAYSDVLYLDNLIGKDTVNTVPPDTLAAFRDHGQPKPTLETGLDEAKATLESLAAAGISLDKATDELLVDAIKKFVEPFHKLLQAVEGKVGEAKAR